MKNFIYTSILTLLAIFVMPTAKAQDALTMLDINFNSINYNTAFIAEKSEVFGASLTNTTAGGIQNTGQINFLAYTQLKSAGIAIGTRVNSKYFGFLRTTQFELNSAKRVQLNSSSAFMASIGMGMQFTSIRSGEINEYADQMDPILQNGEFPQYRFSFSFGLGYVWKNKLRLGLSVPNFAKTESDLNPVYIFNGSYGVNISEDFLLKPEILAFGSSVKALTGEFNARSEFKEKVWLKVGYRTSNTFVGGIGVMVSGIEVGYAYNTWFSEYQSVVPSSHNINLTFRITPGGAEGKERKFQLH